MVCGFDFLGEVQRFLDGFACLTGKSQNKGTVYDNAQLVAILGETPGEIDAHPFLDIDQIC